MKIIGDDEMMDVPYSYIYFFESGFVSPPDLCFVTFIASGRWYQ